MTTIARLTGIEQTIAAALAASTVPSITAVELAERAGLDLDDWQRRILTTAAPRVLMNVTRQGGKSTVAAVLAVHSALTEGGLVLVLSPTLRQSQELFRKCITVYAGAGQPVTPETETKLTLELNNGGRIVSLPGKEGTIRGYSGVRLLVADEASRIPDELYLAVRPMLAVSGGRLVAMSTPFGQRGWFFDAWQSSEAWERVRITADECPRISPAFLAEERAAMPAWWYSQEYLCQFEADSGAVFRYEDIQAAVTPAVTPLFGRTA